VLDGKFILAVVPARSSSKGVADKNLRKLAGISLIGRAGLVLGELDFLDARVISTDSPGYVEEAARFGLDAPFIRPAVLSGDDAGIVETMQHAIAESEAHYSVRFDVTLIIEPSSPMRIAADVTGAVRLLIDSGADSVATMSRVPTKYHPDKLLVEEGGRLDFFTETGRSIVGRQMLSDGPLYKNGLCYALTRECIIDRSAVFTDNTLALITEREVVNVDDENELTWAELLLSARDANAR
jgi:CMP-N,N'-diacetyllegionaminic acid synthase